MIGIVIALASLIAWGIWTSSYYQVPDGFALLRSSFRKQKVFFRGYFWAYPILHQVDKINLQEQRLLVNTIRENSLRTKDCVRLNVQLTFFFQVKHTAWGVLKVAQEAAPVEGNIKVYLDEVWQPKCLQVVRDVVSTQTYTALSKNHQGFKQALLIKLEEHLGGLEINRISIAVLKHLPLDEYDVDHNELDAQGYKNLKRVLDQQ